MGLDIYIKKAPKTITEPNYNNTVEIGYWGKFNALHQWFVENVCNGIDDCAYWEIQKEKLEEFLAVLKSLTPENCEEKLPTQSGFFFGSTEYGDWYWQDVKDAIENIERILNETNFETETLYYRASW